jgi:hypothetical protein
MRRWSVGDGAASMSVLFSLAAVRPTQRCALDTALFSEMDHEHMYPQWQNQFKASIGVMA